MAECSSSSGFSDNTSIFSEKSSKRKIRNESEKRRRDTFNRLIDELTLLVAKGDRKMNKSSVLKCAINFLKQKHFQAESTSDEALSIAMDSKLRITTGCNLPEIVQIYMDALAAGSFCIDCSGHIEHASTSFAALFDDTEMVVTKKLRRQLLITGYLKEIAHNKDRLCTSDVVAESATDNSEAKITKIMEPNESLRFVGVIVPLSNRPESEIMLETISSWERRNANFTVFYNTEFICIDAEGCQLLGYSRFDLLGTSGYDYIHMDDLLQVAECHTQLIKLGTYQIRPHRLRTKSHQWVWIICMAVIEGQTSIKRVRCNYRVISLENVKKFKETIAFTKTKSIEEVPIPSSKASNIASSLQNSHCTTNVINTVCPLSITPSLSSAVENRSKSFCTDDSRSEQINDSASVIIPEKHTSSSCTAKIVVGPLPPKRIRKRGSNESSDTTPSTSFEHTSSLCQQPSVALSSSSVILPTKRRNQIPLAFIEHYPLPDSKIAGSDVKSPNSKESCINVSNLPTSCASTVTPAALSISPMYQQVWEELQRRSEILRQQVLQKEMELRELHLKRFLASLHGDKC
ncbi:Circadian locomoter output cycles protein kaput [Dirofilaria immitis]